MLNPMVSQAVVSHLTWVLGSEPRCMGEQKVCLVVQPPLRPVALLLFSLLTLDFRCTKKYNFNACSQTL